LSSMSVSTSLYSDN